VYKVWVYIPAVLVVLAVVPGDNLAAVAEVAKVAVPVARLPVKKQ
jgi:hypothetical protein